MLTQIFSKEFTDLPKGSLPRSEYVRKKLDNMTDSHLLQAGRSAQITATLAADGWVTLTTPPKPSDAPITQSFKKFTLSNGEKMDIYWWHAYTLIAIDTKNANDPADDVVTIANPHGAVDVSVDEMQTFVVPVADLGTLFDNLYK